MAKSISPTLHSALNSQLKSINTASTEIMELRSILFILLSLFATFGSSQTTWSYGSGGRSPSSNQQGNANPLRPFGTVPPPRNNGNLPFRPNDNGYRVTTQPSPLPGNLPFRPNDHGYRVTTQPSPLPGHHNHGDPLRPFGTVPPPRYNGNSPSRPIDNRYGVTAQPSPSWTGNWGNTNSYPNNGGSNPTRLYPSLDFVRN